MSAFWVKAGAVVMFLAVAAGAFGAHGLKDVLSEPMKAVFETAVRYQMIHGLALFVVAWLSSRNPAPSVSAAGWCFLSGILIFSGSLYILSLTGIKSWGAVTPVGGLAFLAGWVCLVLARVAP
jgi:uncharacterized membrane protein YgdD (TMEM256/DUF423 family)